MEIRKQDALEYHRRDPKGKIEVSPTKPCQTQWDPSLAYTPGTLTIGGLASLSGTNFLEEISGGTAGSGYSVLNVTGGFSLLSSDTLSLLDQLSFTPTDGEVFDIINAASITGTFDNNNVAFAGGSFTVDYNNSGCNSGSACVDLTWNKPTGVTPEPASLLLFGTGLLGLAWLTRRRMREMA